MLIAVELFANLKNLTDVAVAVPLANAGTAALIWSTVANPLRPVSAVLASPPAQWLGKRSYGLYLWQFPVLLASDYYRVSSTGGQALRDALRIVLTFGIGALCYRFWEQPFLRRKKRYQLVEAMPSGVVRSEGAAAAGA